MKQSSSCVFLLSCQLIALSPCWARADGGTVRLSEERGGYRITVLTSPTVLRTGPIDVSVLVQEADTGELAFGVHVTVKVTPRGATAVTYEGSATTEAATNKLCYSAIFDLPEPGWYSVEVSVDGVLEKAEVRFDLEAAPALPSWLAMLPWLGWPVAAVALFGIHQVLVRRRCPSRASSVKHLTFCSGIVRRTRSIAPIGRVDLDGVSGGD